MLVDLTGFAGDCLIHGRVDLRADRLTDQLNGETTLELSEVTLEGLDDGRQVTTATFSIARADLCAVSVDGGPRGDRRLRIATTLHRLQAQIGPYMVLGRLHARPGIEALRSVAERDAMVPFTDATIAYVVAGILEVRDVRTLIINIELASWLREAERGPVARPRLSIIEGSLS